MPLVKAAIARSFPSPPAPLPDPGRGEQKQLVLSAQLTGQNKAKLPPSRAHFPPSPAGGRGGRGVRVVSAQTQAQQTLTQPQSQSRDQTIAHPHAPRKSSHCAVFPLTPGPSPRPGARGAKQLCLSAQLTGQNKAKLARYAGAEARW
jgi:hypothetical protein